ncbi:MAG: type II secretion system protein [Candidatus Saccharibacteria bacterium]|nr:type II secretion system protein [Candidatus Saccharibacteria bacterium]
MKKIVWSNKKYSGFTVIELLIVIAIIGVLTAVVFFSWQFSTDRARLAAIEKNARTIKDYLDVVEFDEKEAAIEFIDKINNGPVNQEIKMSKKDVVVNTNHFSQATGTDRDILIVKCYDDKEECKIDGVKHSGLILFYLINKETKCNLDEALYVSETATIDNLFSNLSTKPVNGFNRYAKLSVDDEGKDNKLRFCVIPIRNSNFESRTRIDLEPER